MRAQSFNSRGGANQVPEPKTLSRAETDAGEGKSPSTQAGEFVREEIHHVREGKHGARSAKQAIAIGLSKARRAGIRLRPPKGPASLREKVADEEKTAKAGSPREPSKTRSRAVTTALERESRGAASHAALSRQAKKSAAKRSRRDRREAAEQAAKTRNAA